MGPSGAALAPRMAPTPASGAPSTRRRSSGSPTLPLRRTTNGRFASGTGAPTPKPTGRPRSTWTG
eukprot:1528275-Lingulodinium_polyedra.AAC.1